MSGAMIPIAFGKPICGAFAKLVDLVKFQVIG
jgi:hypothetical protein